MSPRLHEQLDAMQVEERCQALRRLLMRPLLNIGTDREALQLVRRHGDYLHDWLGRYPGWHLHLEAEVARLIKTPAQVGDSTHPAREPRHQQPFTRRRYVLLCLALASCERAGRQTTLKHLWDYLHAAILGDATLLGAGLTMDPQRREDRSDVVAIGRYLVEHQVIMRIHGDEEGYLAGSGDCLYSINRTVLARLLAVRRSPTQVAALDWPARVQALQAEPIGDGEENRRKAIRQRLVRLLLERPVVYFAELSPEEGAYFRSQRHFLLRDLCQATGLHAEIRGEGVALVDPEGELTDFRLPEEGTDGHAALLLAGWLVEQLRAHPDRPQVPMAAVQAHLLACAVRFGSRWRRDACTVDGSSQLTAALLNRLSALDLLRIDGGMVEPLPALARFGLADEEVPEVAPSAGGQPGAQQSLFADQP